MKLFAVPMPIILLILLVCTISLSGQSFNSLYEENSNIQFEKPGYSDDKPITIRFNGYENVDYKIEKLERVSLSLNNRRSKTFKKDSLVKVLNKYPQIKMLELQSYRHFEEWGLDFSQYKYIESVQIGISKEDSINEMIWGQLLALKSLKTLSLFGGHNVSEIRLTKHLLNLIESIEELKLEYLILQGCENQTLDNDQLRTLIYKHSNYSSKYAEPFYEGLRFFSHANFIENLVVSMPKGHDFNEKPILQYFRGLQNLEIFYGIIDDNSNVFDDLEVSQKLKSLYMKCNRGSFTRNISKWPSLEKLAISVSIVPKFETGHEIFQLGNLTYLDINFLVNSHNLAKMTALKTLHLAGTKRSCNIDFGKLQKLEQLKIRCDNMVNFPENIYSLRNLKELSIEARNMERVGQEINRLNKLEILSINSRSIVAFPALTSLTKLRSLSIENILIQKSEGGPKKTSNVNFSKLLRSIDNLEYLNLSNSKFSDKQLSDLFKDIVEISHPNFELNLENCSISTLPDVHWKKVKIKNLNLKGNNIQSIPNSFYKLDLVKSYIPFKSEHNSTINNNVDLKLLGFRNGKFNLKQLYNQIELHEVLNRRSTTDEEKEQFIAYYCSIDYARAAEYINPLLLANYHLSREEHSKAAVFFKKHIAINSHKAYRMYKSARNIVPVYEYQYVASCINAGEQNNALKFQKRIDVIVDSLTIESQYCSYEVPPLLSEYYRNFIIHKKLKQEDQFKKYLDLCEALLTRNGSIDMNNISQILDLLEFYIISGQPDKFQDLYLKIDHLKQERDAKFLLEYLLAMYTLVELNDATNYEALVENNGDIKIRNLSWSCDIMNFWNSLQEDEHIQKKIEELNKLVESIR